MDDYLRRYLSELEDEAGFNDEPIGPHTRARTGDQPLHIAAINGDLRAIELLLDEGVNLNARGEGGMTPLLYAVGHARFEAVKLLLERGADRTPLDDSGNSVRDWAVWSKNAGILALLAAD
jgi:ankyrin repeat protein